MSEPTNPTADGEIADPQGSNFVASFPDTRNTRTVRPDPHSSVRDAKGVISSARASHGGILTSPPDENSIVQVGRITMPVSSALREGILVEQPDGSFVDGPAITGNTPQEGQQDGTTEGATPTPRRTKRTRFKSTRTPPRALLTSRLVSKVSGRTP